MIEPFHRRAYELLRRHFLPYPPATWLPTPPYVPPRGTITLGYGHPSIDSFYTGCHLVTSDGQIRVIHDYHGATRRAEFAPWPFVEPTNYLIVEPTNHLIVRP